MGVVAQIRQYSAYKDEILTPYSSKVDIKPQDDEAGRKEPLEIVELAVFVALCIYPSFHSQEVCRNADR